MSAAGSVGPHAINARNRPMPIQSGTCLRSDAIRISNGRAPILPRRKYNSSPDVRAWQSAVDRARPLWFSNTKSTRVRLSVMFTTSTPIMIFTGVRVSW